MGEVGDQLSEVKDVVEDQSWAGRQRVEMGETGQGISVDVDQLSVGGLGDECGEAEDEGAEFRFVARGNSRAQCLLDMVGKVVL